MAGLPPSGRMGRFGCAGGRVGYGIAARAAGLSAMEVAMMLFGLGALYLVAGALFATIVVPLLAVTAMVSTIFGVVWILL